MVQDAAQPVTWKIFLHGVVQKDLQRFVFAIDGTNYEPHEPAQVAMVFGKTMLAKYHLLYLFGMANNVNWDFAAEILDNNMLGVLFVFDSRNEQPLGEIRKWMERYYRTGIVRFPYLFVALAGPDGLTSEQLKYLLPLQNDELVICDPDDADSCRQVVLKMWEEHRMKSPKILDFSWGRLVIEGYADEFKDAKLYPGGARDWDWSETGTRHVPGIQPADVQELVDQGAEIVVLSKGVHERLQTCPETLDLLNEREIITHVLQTEQAIEKYNELVGDNQRVGALIHSTC